MKYFVLAGEASGDKQAALLCESILRHDPNAAMTGWGGEAMEAVGVKVTKHYRELAFMGFVEVIKHLPAILKNFKTCKAEILQHQPDALILVDYPGFNLRMARWAHQEGISVYYYISPQLWAWHTSRVHGIKRAVRKMYVILPFEKDFYHQFGMEVVYVGHPLAVEISKQSAFDYQPFFGKIALLPGSRRHEVERILPEMAQLIHRMPNHQFLVSAVPHLPSVIYDHHLSGLQNVERITGGMKTVLGSCEAAIVTSGTATLETALLGVPQIVVYRGSPLSYQLAKRLIKVKYISLVNLIMDKLLVPELIQGDCNAENMERQLAYILQPDVRKSMLLDYKRLKEKLVEGGGAEAAAMDIISDISKTKAEHGLV